MSEFSDWLQNNWIDLARLGVQIAILGAIVRYGRRVLAAVRASQEQIGALLKLSVTDGVSAAREQHSERDAEPIIEKEPFAEPRQRREAAWARESEPRVAISEPAFEATATREAARQSIWDLPEPQPVFQETFVGPSSMRSDYPQSTSMERAQGLGGRVTSEAVRASTAVLDPPLAHNEPMHGGEQPVPRSEVRPFTPWVSAPTTVPDVRNDPAAPAVPRRTGGVQSWLNAPIKRNSGPGPVKRMVRWLQAPVRTHPRPAR